MSVRTRNLLDRFSQLVLPSVRLLDDSSQSIDVILRAINLRQLTEAVEVARIIYNEINPQLASSTSQVDAVRSEVNQISGASYWTRQLLIQAAQQAHQSTKHPLAKAYDNLQEVVKLISRKAKSLNAKGRDSELELRIRNYVQITRTFYEYADWALPIY